MKVTNPKKGALYINMATGLPRYSLLSYNMEALALKREVPSALFRVHFCRPLWGVYVGYSNESFKPSQTMWTS